MADQQKISQVKNRYEKQWLAINEVAAIGIGRMDDQAGIIISVTDNQAEVRKKIPAQIEGVSIMVQETGKFRAQ